MLYSVGARHGVRSEGGDAAEKEAGRVWTLVLIHSRVCFVDYAQSWVWGQGRYSGFLTDRPRVVLWEWSVTKTERLRWVVSSFCDSTDVLSALVCCSKRSGVPVCRHHSCCLFCALKFFPCLTASHVVKVQPKITAQGYTGRERMDAFCYFYTEKSDLK